MELFMEQFVGLDVSQKLTHVCVVDQKGSVIWRGTCLSTPEDIAATVRAKAPDAVRIGLETGPLSTWHWHALKAMGLPVICIDARHAKAALSMQVNKTDRNDAAGLAQIMRTGWYREVGVKSLDNHQIRAVLGARAQLVGMQTDLKNQIRGLLKVFGTVLQRGHSQSFEQQVIAASQGNELLDASVRGFEDRWRASGKAGSAGHQTSQGERHVPPPDEHSRCRGLDRLGVHDRDRGSRQVPKVAQRRRVSWPDAEALPIRRDRLGWPYLQTRRRPCPRLPV